VEEAIGAPANTHPGGCDVSSSWGWSSQSLTIPRVWRALVAAAGLLLLRMGVGRGRLLALLAAAVVVVVFLLF
jgi:hypothetical protein